MLLNNICLKIDLWTDHDTEKREIELLLDHPRKRKVHLRMHPRTDLTIHSRGSSTRYYGIIDSSFVRGFLPYLHTQAGIIFFVRWTAILAKIHLLSKFSFPRIVRSDNRTTCTLRLLFTFHNCGGNLSEMPIMPYFRIAILKMFLRLSKAERVRTLSLGVFFFLIRIRF